MEEAKFQWSRSLPDGVIIVVRGEDIVTFMLDVRAMQKEFHLLQGETESTANPMTSQEPTREPVEEKPETTVCPIHHADMKNRGNFYSHARKLGEEWDYCNGSGWKSEKK